MPANGRRDLIRRLKFNGITRGVLTIEYVCTELLTAQIGLTVFIFISLIKWYYNELFCQEIGLFGCHKFKHLSVLT
jgi:hypothetical protein